MTSFKHNRVVDQEIVVGSNVDKIYIVMDYVEHDLKSLMETMKQPFLVGQFMDILSGFHTYYAKDLRKFHDKANKMSFLISKVNLK